MAFGLSGLSSLFGQGTVQALGAGLLTGVVGGAALVASGVIPPATSTPTATITLLACPGAGPAMAQINDGERLLVTGRSADGQWLEVYIGQPGIDRAWVQATSLSIQSSSDDLPVADCAAPLPAPLPSPAPIASPTEAPTAEPTLSPSPSSAPFATPTATARVTEAPTPRPTKTPAPTPKKTPKPTPTHAPTPTPDTTGPSLTNVMIAGGFDCGGEHAGATCLAVPECPASHAATISVTATDPSGVIDTNLWFRQPGAGGYTAVGLNHDGDVWSGTINAGNWMEGQIEYFWEGFDSVGNQSSLSNPSNRILRVAGCIL